AAELTAYAEGRGIRPGHFATAWVLANPLVSAVIAGPRTLAQMQDYYAALDVQITPEEETMVNAWVTPGHASTPGYNDPSYPFYGRPVTAAWPAGPGPAPMMPPARSGAVAPGADSAHHDRTGPAGFAPAPAGRPAGAAPRPPAACGRSAAPPGGLKSA